MKKIFLALLILLALGLLALPRVLKNGKHNFSGDIPPNTLPTNNAGAGNTGAKGRLTLEINGIKVKIEIAKTQAEQTNGLGGRETLAQDEGMLFLFGKPAIQRFWMRGMKFPLDILWIRNDEVRGITKNIQPPAPNSPGHRIPVVRILREDVDWVQFPVPRPIQTF